MNNSLPGVFRESQLSRLLSNLDEIRAVMRIINGPSTAPVTYPPRSAGPNIDVSLPKVVVVGEESSGKSSVIARLCGMDIFPRARGICTRMPIELNLQNKTTAEMEEFCRENDLRFAEGVAHVRVKTEERTSSWLGRDMISQLREQLELTMNEMVRARNQALSGILNGTLVVEVVSTHLPNMQFVDLPGVVAANRTGEPADLPQKTQRLVDRYIREPHTLIIAVLPASERMNNNKIIGMIQAANKIDMTWEF